MAEGNLELEGGVSGMVGRSQQASGDMCGHVHWRGKRERERRRERGERGMIDDDEREEREDKAFCVCS